VNAVDREVGTLGWVYLGAVLLAVLAWAGWALWWAPVGNGAPGAGDTADSSQDQSPGFMRVTEKGLLEWLKRADPIPQCSDVLLLRDLSRGAHATAKMARNFGNLDDAVRWGAVAIAAYERLAELSDVGQGSPYRRISELYLDMADFAQAVDYEKKHIAWKEKTGLDAGRLTLGKLLVAAERHEEALDELGRAALSDGSAAARAEAHLLIGGCFETTKRPAEALEAYGQAIDAARKGLQDLTPEVFDSRGTFLIRPAGPDQGVASVSRIGEPPDSRAVKKLVEEKGYKIVNEQMRAKGIRELEGLLVKATKRITSALYEMGRPDEETPSSQPVDDESPTPPPGTAP